MQDRCRSLLDACMSSIMAFCMQLSCPDVGELANPIAFSRVCKMKLAGR